MASSRSPGSSTAATRAVGYLRRSTDRQEQSIPDQKKAVEEYARTSGSRRRRRPGRSGSMRIESGRGEIRRAPDMQSRARPATSGRPTRRPIGGDFGSRRVAPGSAQSRTTDEVKSLLLNTLNA